MQRSDAQKLFYAEAKRQCKEIERGSEPTCPPESTVPLKESMLYCELPVVSSFCVCMAIVVRDLEIEIDRSLQVVTSRMYIALYRSV